MKQIKILSLLAVLLLTTTVAQGQNKVMQVHSGGNVVYAANTSQVDSITFKMAYLPWLEDKIDIITFHFHNYPVTTIYQCLYDGGKTGFLETRGLIAYFYNYEGERICMTDESIGFTNCSELNIDFENKEIIWKMEEVIVPCEFKNPLTDLPWLKDKVDELTLLFQSNHSRYAIYQYLYDGGKIGFLDDRGNGKDFYNCEGKMLCMLGGFTGSTCPDLNIDFESEKLIWEIKK